MESNKYIKGFRAFIVIALVISLVMNFTLLSRLEQLENQVNSISYSQNDILNNVNSQTRQIEGVLTDIEKEQSWISSINMELDPKGIDNGQVEASFEWQVKELQSNSEVTFYYAYGDTENYTALPLEESQQGLFQVKIPFEVTIEPLWEVRVINTGSNTQQEISEKEMDEKMIEDNRQKNSLKYFVSVAYDDMLKSGDIHTEYLGYLGTNYYGTVQTDIEMDDENVRVALTNYNVDNSSIVVEEAFLLKYENETFLGEEVIDSENENVRHGHGAYFFQLEAVKQYEDMRLVIKVVYSDGAIFEKEVYSNSN